MSEKRKRPAAPEPQEEDDSVDSDRPTVAPPFDPAEFAKSSMADSSKRPPQVTITDEAELEDARKRSAAPALEPPTGRSSLLSMVNANSPSVAPPTLAKPVILDEHLSELDRAWASDEAPTPTPEPAPASRPKAGAKALAETARPKRESSRSAKPASEPTKPPLSDEPFTEEAPTNPKGQSVPPPKKPSSPRGKRRNTADFQAQRAPTMPAPPDEPDPQQDMRDRFSLGDYSGALAVAEAILESNARDREAQECADNCRSVLKQMYTARLGALDRVPLVMVPPDQLRWLSIDHKAGFVLSHIDGVSSLEMILDVSGMPTLEALRILCELAQQRIISFR